MPNRIEWFEDAPADVRRRGELGRFKDIHKQGGPGQGARVEFEHGQLVLAGAAADEEAAALADSILVLCDEES